MLPRLDYLSYGGSPYDAITEVIPVIRDRPGELDAQQHLPYLGTGRFGPPGLRVAAVHGGRAMPVSAHEVDESKKKESG